MYEKYLSILKEHSLKITQQRLEILKYLDEHRCHPTVDDIYKALRQKSPSLSKTTVYNSLELLKKHNIIQNVNISASESRYDYRSDSHQHFLCRICGRIIDINIECPKKDKILEEGHKIEEVHGYFKGICKTCLAQGKE
jgi:Fe2+ or Zn2+ uptake regulation protein